MGIVYLAEQEEPIRRRVALKVIKPGMDSKQVIARFEAERQALAMMDHPNVAKVFDAGATPEGRPFFAMEYVAGIPITKYCDKHRLTTRQRLELFTRVCEGVQHAHQKGIIHRDIKPSNVLVALQDERPVPKVIDFGVAKAVSQRLTEKTLFTQHGVLIGTPEYMSPEQAEMTTLDIDTRTDVYSLGVILYELLVGALPFDSKELRRGGYESIRRKIREEEPPRPSTRLSTLGERSTESAKLRQVDLSTLQRQLRGDLDWITMKDHDEGAGEGPDASIRVAVGPRRRPQAAPQARAGAGRASVGGVPGPEVRPSASSRRGRGRGRRSGTGGVRWNDDGPDAEDRRRAEQRRAPA
jgi:serine/threonine protein kinase